MLRFFLNVVAAILALAVAIPTAAAQPRPDLIVTLRDGVGAGVVGATVQVRDLDEGTITTQETTDTTGTAVFLTLAVSAVRVVVQGRLADGTPLTQPGQDAGGIAFYLGVASNRLDLRVEADGTVLPDPQTMLAPDVGIDDATTVTSTVTPQPTTRATATPARAPTIAPVIAIDAMGDPVAEAPASSPFGWLLVIVLGCALLTVLALLVLARRGA